MKRFLAILLALSLLLCLCACGKDTPDHSADPEQTKPSENSPVNPLNDPYEKLHQFIRDNGEAQEDAWAYTSGRLTMTADSNGGIHWKHLSPNGTMVWELELLKNSQSHNFSVTYTDFSASAVLEDTKGTMSDFNCSHSKYSDNLQNWLNSGVSGMMNSARPVLEAAGVTLDDFLPAESANAPSVEHTPVEDTPVEDTPVEDTHVEDTPVEDTPVEDTPVEDTPVEDTPVEDTPSEKPDLNIDPAILGKYRIYKMADAYGTYDYNTTIGNHGVAYIQLNANGTADVCDSGEVLTGLEWNGNKISQDNGQSLWFSIDGDTLTVSQGANKLIYIHENSETWDSVPTGYQKLHDYIVKKGTKKAGKYIYTTHKGYFSLIVDADGIIWWESTAVEGKTVTVKLVDGTPFQTVTLVCDDYTCSIDTDITCYIKYGQTKQYANFQTDAEGDQAEKAQSNVKNSIDYVITLAKQAMEPANICFAYLCMTMYE